MKIILFLLVIGTISYFNATPIALAVNNCSSSLGRGSSFADGLADDLCDIMTGGKGFHQDAEDSVNQAMKDCGGGETLEEVKCARDLIGMYNCALESFVYNMKAGHYSYCIYD